MADKEKSKAKKTAMEVAASYLSNRMRTVEEMRKHLKEKEFSENEIEETINDLIGLKYLDDYAYAVRYYEYNTEKHRGSFRAMRELEEKGVDKQTVKFALEDYLYENKIDEYELALEVARKEEFTEVDDKLIAKVARKLESRGFKRDDIYRVLDEMRRWDNSKLS
ncbi:MAG: RecX family transcriptional regulator [Clostridiales bacterium]|nr:RecX family transcriptional regulator [Candidatus Crickella equi]